MAGTGNRTLITVQQCPRNEYYTRREDIIKELKHWPGRFRGKTVYCNCDDYRWSQFYQVFRDKFHELGLKRLLCTGYNQDGPGTFAEYDGQTETTGELVGNGDFRSEECMAFFRRADFISSNPPFSLIKTYYPLLRDSGKEYLFLAPLWLWSYALTRAEVRRGTFRPGRECNHFNTPAGETVTIGHVSWCHNLEYIPPWPRPKFKGGLVRDIDNYTGVREVGRLCDWPLVFRRILMLPITAVRFINTDEYEIMGRADDTYTRSSELGKIGPRIGVRLKDTVEPFDRNEVVLGTFSWELWYRYRNVIQTKQDLWEYMRPLVLRLERPKGARIKVEDDFIALTAMKYGASSVESYGLEGDLIFCDVTADDAVRALARRWRDSIFPELEEAVRKHFGGQRRFVFA